MNTPTDVSIFGDYNKPVKTYFYYDGPMSFLTEHNGRQFYWHFYDYMLNWTQFWVREVTPEELVAAETNKINLRDLLKTSNPFYVVKDYHGKWIDGVWHCVPPEAFIVEVSDFPDNEYPAEDAYLNYKQE